MPSYICIKEINVVMDLALKKIELIEWLARLQDEAVIRKIEILRKGSAMDLYEQRTPKNLDDLAEKLKRSEEDILNGKIHSQEEVESFIESRISKHTLQQF